MIKALWFFLKAAVLVGVVLWVAERPGSVRVEWMEYAFTLHMGFFLLLLAGTVLLAIFAYLVINAIFSLPSAFKYYSHVKGREKGYRALTVGLAAVAAGDTRGAMRESARAKRYLADDEGLGLLLEAQAARLDGREGDAQAGFIALLENKDAAFLGVRGLLQSALERGDDEEALVLVERALVLHPKQGKILQVCYDLNIRLRRWHAAREVLKRAVRAGAVTAERAKSDRCAMALALALEADEQGLQEVAEREFSKARRIDPGFVPAVILHAEYYVRVGQVKKARGLVERSWKRDAHPALLVLWRGLMPQGDDVDALARLRWMERLLVLKPQSAEALVAVGVAALDCGLWGEARSHLAKAEDIGPSAALYKALAALEDKATGNRGRAREWLEKAAEAPVGEAWVCRESGRVYGQWSPIAEPHDAFNTIEWGLPHYGGGLRLSNFSDMDVSVFDMPMLKSGV